MRKLFILFLTLGVLGPLPLLSQEEAADPQTEVKPALQQRALFAYSPEGRRDPFKDLLGGADLREKTAADASQMPFEDMKLTGITKTQRGWNAILETSQGFPRIVRIGDKFPDGYILTIDENKVVFRKTHERGIPLMRPRDITKEINPEER
jgi:Tfp pilus assembly protein PilP